MKKYIFTLCGMLGVAATLNSVAIVFKGDYVGISLATLVSYYIWLFYSQHDFEEIDLEKKDYIYLVGFFVIYYGIKYIGHDILGFFIYGVAISIWSVLIYKEAITVAFRLITKKFLKKYRNR